MQLHAQARPRHPHRDDRRRHPDRWSKPARSPTAARTSCRARCVATFALGSNKLYRFLRPQPGARDAPGGFHQRSLHRRPQRQPACAINATHADRPHRPVRLGEPRVRRRIPAPAARPTSCRSANRSKGGKAFIVLPSDGQGRHHLAHRADAVEPGTHVTTSKNDINYVVTEYGVAQLRGKTARQRARR
ncbi:MAG: hypothetical protein MZW92_00440 [Comamonadaceae bacterium]|nr:hypothetical protein [Comamonadaceae bacterium]